MKITWKDLTIEFSHIPPENLTKCWTWLIGEDMKPIMLSSIGDMFLIDSEGKIYWLDVGGGELKPAAQNFEELEQKMKDDTIANEWFMFNLVIELKESGLELTEGKLYSYKKLPIIGGEYHPANFELTDIEVHFALTGQIHEKIKDLPDGTEVRFKIKKT